MDDHLPDEQKGTCPTCGAALDYWPCTDGRGTVAVCPNCSAGPTPLTFDSRDVTKTATQDAPARDTRLKKLLKPTSQAEEVKSLDQLLDDLDPEARQLLQAGASTSQEPSDQESLREDLAQSLRYQGYTVQEDKSGVRLSGSPRISGLDSPYDIVRMAAELEGGLKPDAERVRCPECDAVCPGSSTTCQWCGASLPSSDSAGPDPTSS